jgi:Tol biopolymer transport system component
MSAIRRGPIAAVVAFALAACGGSAALSPSPGVPTSPAPTESALSTRPLASPSIELTPSSEVGQVPPGTIAFARGGADGADHYFTIRTDGSNEHELFSSEEHDGIRWSPDGAQIWTLAPNDLGTLSFVTMDADGGNLVVHVPSIETLNLAGGPATSDGQQIAFFGWDDTDPDLSGLYIGSPDLRQLTQVLALPDGVTAIDPLAFAPDGSGVLFWGQRGSDGGVTHAGDLFMVDADGTDLRQLNSDDFLIGEVKGPPGSLSPDGGRAAFAAFERGSEGARSAAFVVSVNGGEAERITDISSGIWIAAWAPVGDRIASWRWTSEQTALSIVNADGTNTRQLAGGADEVGYAAWSPTGDYLVAERGPDRHRDLWIIDLEGRFVAQVTHDPSSYGLYSWQPESIP